MSEPRHNPWDYLCSKHNLGEPTDPEARCPVCRPVVRQPASEPASETVVVRVYEGDPLPAGCCFLRLIATEDVPWGTGTATRRLNTLLLARAEAGT